MVLMVLGSDGQVGAALRWKALERGTGVIGLNRVELDITQPGRVMDAIRDIRPETVINCAAWTDVDGAEKEGEAAHAINAAGAENVAKACARTGAALIHLSTDYVFDGTKATAYSESDPVSPVSVYGRTKEAGERAVRDTWGKHVILRTAWVFGAHGGNFMKTMLRLADQGMEKLNVVDDQRGGPTPADAIADACLDVAARANSADIAPWGTYHFCGRPSVTWHGFASAILKDRQITLNPCTTAEFPRPAPRPANSVLDCTRIRRAFGIEQPDWREYLPELVDAFGTSIRENET
jgi:dTDP-4-dehydrorhamnose reductase